MQEARRERPGRGVRCGKAKTYKSSMGNTRKEGRAAGQVENLGREMSGRVLRPIGEEGVSGRRGIVRDGRECYKKASTGSGLVERKAGRCGRALGERWLAEAGSRPVAAGGQCGWAARDLNSNRSRQAAASMSSAGLEQCRSMIHRSQS